MAKLTIDVDENASVRLARVERVLASLAEQSARTSQQMGRLASTQHMATQAANAEAESAGSLHGRLLRLYTAYSALNLARRTSIGQQVEANAVRITAQAYGVLEPTIGRLILAYPRLFAVMSGSGARAAAESALARQGVMTFSTSLTATSVSAGLAATSLARTLGVIRNLTVFSLAASAGLNGIEAVLARTGRGGSDAANNLERVARGAREFGGALRRPLEEGAAAAAAIAESLNPLPTIYRRIDAAATAAAKSTESGLKQAAAAATEYIEALRAGAVYLKEGEEASVRYQEEVEQLKSLQKEFERLDAHRDKEKAHFARLREVTQQLAKDERRRAEDQEIAALKTVEAVNAQIQKEKEAAGQRAAALKMTADEVEAYHRRVQELEQRKVRIVEESERAQQEARAKSIREREQAEEKAARDAEQRQRAFQRATEKAREEETQRQEKLREIRIDDEINGQELLFDRLLALRRQQGASERELHEIRRQQIENEHAFRQDVARTDIELERAQVDERVALHREETRFQEEEFRRQVEARRAKAEAELKAEQEKRERLKRMLDQANILPNGDKMLAGVDRRRVLAALQEQAAAEARADFAADKKNSKKYDRTSEASMAKFERDQGRAEARARAKTAYDFQSGRVDPGKMIEAAASAGQQQLQALAANGQLSQDVVQVLQEQMKTAAEQMAMTTALQKQVQALAAVARGQGQQASQQRRAAQRNGSE